MIQEIEKHINSTVLSCMDVKEMIDTVGKILLRQLKSRINSLKMEVDNKSVQRTGELQEVLAALQRPTQLYLQMKQLLDSHPNAVHFLREDKPLRAEADKLAHEVLPQAPMEGNISVAYYLRELVKGINIKDFSSSGMNNVPLESREAINAWVSICSDLNTLPTDDLDQVIRRIMCSLGFKDKNESLLSMASASYCVNSAQQMEELPAERTDV
ncbi:uncharacterized protein LOC132381788 [Hypanus sabinus]|uniref:uncharacterized protein LOC132381788 n=1 Tax=Hypanus sabinus TaxID=79690 RepID=UPI0028C42CB5|nr:uncharacterized protein LOC132381788 [Hypanus sabinus]